MSQLIFNDGMMKSRLIRKDENWYVSEYKEGAMEQWYPWICGTAEFLGLNDQEKTWAIDKRQSNRMR